MNLKTDNRDAVEGKAGTGGRSRVSEVLSILVFAACVAILSRHTVTSGRQGDASAYHEEVRRSVADMPKEFGEWSGIDVPIPTQAEALLRPTAFMSRRYVNRMTGETCIVMIIDCGNARDMLDHYPPNCYPGQGWVLRQASPADVPASFGTVYATEYQFSRGRFGANSEATVVNAMLLPNGRTDRDMAGVERLMGDSGLRRYGVGQLQVYFDQAIAADRRNEIVRFMVEAHRGAVVAILRGVEPLPPASDSVAKQGDARIQSDLGG